MSLFPLLSGERQNFDSKYLANGDRYEVGPLIRRTHWLSIGTVTFDLGSKIEAKK